MSLIGYMSDFGAITATQIIIGRQEWRRVVLKNKIRAKVINRYAYVSFCGEFQFGCPEHYLWRGIYRWYSMNEECVIRGDTWAK